MSESTGRLIRVLLAEVVQTSENVASTRSRTQKIADWQS